MRVRRIIAQQGLTGLFRALARGVALPSLALQEQGERSEDRI